MIQDQTLDYKVLDTQSILSWPEGVVFLILLIRCKSRRLNLVHLDRRLIIFVFNIPRRYIRFTTTRGKLYYCNQQSSAFSTVQIRYSLSIRQLFCRFFQLMVRQVILFLIVIHLHVALMWRLTRLKSTSSVIDGKVEPTNHEWRRC